MRRLSLYLSSLLISLIGSVFLPGYCFGQTSAGAISGSAAHFLETEGQVGLPSLADLHQALRNYLNNAIKFTGDVPPRIEIGAGEHERGYMISISSWKSRFGSDTTGCPEHSARKT